MMKIITILCLVLLSVHSYSQEVATGPFLIRGDIYYHQDTNEPVTGIVEEFHKNGRLRDRGNYKDGKRDGPFEGFYEDGQLFVRGNYKDGELDGLVEEFYENGQVFIKRNYKNGKLDGPWEMFHKNGWLKMRGNN